MESISDLLESQEGFPAIKAAAYTEAIRKTGGHREKAAKLLHVSIRALRDFLNKNPSIKKLASELCKQRRKLRGRQ